MKNIQITSKKDGFRRAGIAHSATPTLYPIDQFTKEQLEQLKAEPMLIVNEVDVAEEGKGKGKNKES